MIRLGIWITCFMLVFISGCSSPQIIESENTSYVWLDINLGFVSNTSAVFDASLVSPSPGLHDFEENTTVELVAQSSDKYAFNKWIVNPDSSDSREVFEKNFSLLMDRDHVVSIFFGCVNDNACPFGFNCEIDMNICIESKFTDASFFRVAYSEFGPSSDIFLANDLLIYLEKKGYVVEKEMLLFENIDALNLFNYVLMAVFEGEIIIIRGSTSSHEMITFSQNLMNYLEDLGVTSDNIKIVNSFNIENSNLISLFI